MERLHSSRHDADMPGSPPRPGSLFGDHPVTRFGMDRHSEPSPSPPRSPGTRFGGGSDTGREPEVDFTLASEEVMHEVMRTHGAAARLGAADGGKVLARLVSTSNEQGERLFTVLDRSGGGMEVQEMCACVAVMGNVERYHALFSVFDISRSGRHQPPRLSAAAAAPQPCPNPAPTLTTTGGSIAGSLPRY